MNFGNQVEWNNRILITGQSGTGKSWFRDWIINYYIKCNKRRYYIIVDDRLSNAERLYKKSFKIQEIENLKYVNKLRNFIRYHEKVYFIINMDRERTNEFLEKLINILYTLKDILFVTDESHLFYKRYKEPDGIEKLLRNGRKDGIDQIYVTQRLVDISPDIVDLCNRKISFRITGKNSVERIAEFYDKFDGNFNNLDDSLIDNEISKKDKKIAKKLINKFNKPEYFVSNLSNRFYLYAKEESGKQEISSTNDISI